MKLDEVLRPNHYLYHLGANIPTNQLRPLTFFTNSKRGAMSFAQVASYDEPKLHIVINNITHPAREADVFAAAKDVGAYPNPNGAGAYYYIFTGFDNKKEATAIANNLRKKGFDGVVLKDVAADQRTNITSYVPFNRPKAVTK